MSILNFSSHSWGEPPQDDDDDADDLFPNGFRRSDYHSYGITDCDIEMWGLDKPGAPPPSAAGWAVWDVIEEMDW